MHYKEMGVNPLAGCLPLLVQMPFWIAIYWALKDTHTIQTCTISYGFLALWIQIQCTFLPILSALSTWVMSRQTSNGATGAAANNKRL